VTAVAVETAPPERPAARRTLRLHWEAALVVVGAVALACWTNRSAIEGLTTTVAGDLGDPLYFAWQLAWVRHALGTDPGSLLWTTPAFQGARDNLAFTDTVLGYTPLGLFVGDGQAGALALLNLAWLASCSFAIMGGYVLARAMRVGRFAALVSAAGFGFAPWRIQQIIHINVVSVGVIALALGLLARGNGWSLRDGWQPERMSWRWIAAGWAAACYQLTFGWAVGIWFVYSVGIPMLLWTAGWLLLGRRRARLTRPVLLAHGLGGLAFAVTGWLLLRPYLRVIAAHPEAKRGENWLPLFSPPWRGLLTAPPNDWFWADRQVDWRTTLTWPPEMILSPGIVLVVLALTGVGFSVYPWRRRLLLALATAVLVVLAMGTAFPLGHGEWTYLPLFRHAPGWSALRTTGRLIIFVTLGLCLLAAGAVSRFYREVRPARPLRGRVRTGGAVVAALLAVVPAGAVVVEGLNVVPHWTVPTSPVRLASFPQPVLLLPSDIVGDYHMMLWGTEGWPLLANGSSGFDPPNQTQLRSEAASFPDSGSVEALRRRGIRTVVIIRSRAVGSMWATAPDRPIDGLDLTRADFGDAVVYTLRPPT